MLKHPFQQPGTQVIEVGGEEVHQFPPDPPGPLAIVLTVTSVTGGQRITFREQTSTSRTNATPTNADNPFSGEAMVPIALGTVSVGDLVTTFPLPGRDELVAVPSKNSQLLLQETYNGTQYGATSAYAVWASSIYGSGPNAAWNDYVNLRADLTRGCMCWAHGAVDRTSLGAVELRIGFAIADFTAIFPYPALLYYPVVITFPAGVRTGWSMAGWVPLTTGLPKTFGVSVETTTNGVPNGGIPPTGVYAAMTITITPSARYV